MVSLLPERRNLENSLEETKALPADISLPANCIFPLWQEYKKLLRPDAIKSYTIPPPALMLYEDGDHAVWVAAVFLMCTQLTSSLCLY